MTANRNAPAGNRSASKVRFVDEESNTSIIPEFWPANPIYEARLAAWAEGYEARESEIAKLKHRITRLEYLVDLWYFCYANRKTPANFYRHQTSELWRAAVSS